MADFAVIFGAAKFLPGFVRMLFPRLPLNERQAIRDALRKLYFTPKGTLGLLERIARGERPNLVEEAVLIDFHEAEAEVNRAISFLTMVVEREGIEYSDQFIFYLDMIKYRKFEVRSLVSDFFQHGIAAYPIDTPQSARSLIAAVRDLNAAILQVDNDIGLTQR